MLRILCRTVSVLYFTIIAYCYMQYETVLYHIQYNFYLLDFIEHQL